MSHSSPPRSNGRDRNGNGGFLQKTANLSTVVTLVALIGFGATAQSKLNEIETRSVNNCRSVNNGLILTLELSRAKVDLSRREIADLDRTIGRFQVLEDKC